MVITFDNVSFRYTEKYLLDKVSFSITDKEKIGIVGVNGSGKTTLLNLILQQEKPQFGNIYMSGNMKISYLPQTPKFAENISIFNIIKQEETKDFPIEDYQIKTILNKLKLFNHDIYTNNLSGGEKKRLALAKCLLTPSDLLILDEPTNHLDQDMIIWLETYLKKWKKGLLMVTHDRYFLENVCEKMLEVDDGNVFIYEANYSKFLELKQQRLEILMHEIQKHKSIYKHELAWMRRGAQARTTKSKSRIERFEELASKKFKESKTFEFSSIKTYLGKKLIEIKNGSKSFTEKTLFKDFSFKLNRYDRIGIVGPNGCGKSTLFKIIMGLENLDNGELELGETLRIGYFSQHLELSNENMTLIDYIKEESNAIETVEGIITAKDILEMFLFTDEKIYGLVKLLSGGEKRRLQLIRVLMKNPNILIFDEPTNDLDLQTLEILENYLEDYFGPVLVVSHDRYFLDKICDTLWVFEDSNIKTYQMKFTDYLKIADNTTVTAEVKGQKPKRKISSTIRNEYKKLQEDIPLLEDKIVQLVEALKKETSAYMKIMELTSEKEELEILLDEKINRLFELEELMSEEN